MSTVVVGSIDPGYPGVASALWIPAATDNLSFDASGAAHVCLAANLVYPAGSTVTPKGQGQVIPQFVASGQPVQMVFPCGDGPVDPRSLVPIGHFQGQKNVRVMSADAAELTASLSVSGSGDGTAMRVLQLAERVGPEMLTQVLREHLLAHPAVGLVGRRPRERLTTEVGPEALEQLGAQLRRIVLTSTYSPAGESRKGVISNDNNR
jgi:hypothetical protein